MTRGVDDEDHTRFLQVGEGPVLSVAAFELHTAGMVKAYPGFDGPVEQLALAGRGLVQANGSSNEGRESLLIDFIVLVEVDCAPGVAFEA